MKKIRLTMIADGKIRDPKFVEAIIINDFLPALELGLHRAVDADGWKITEIQTGAAVVHGSTQQETVKKLHALVTEVGISKIIESRDKAKLMLQGGD